MYTRRRLTVYIPNNTPPPPNGELFVAYFHTDDPQKALIDPFFYEHAARGDLECKVWIAELATGFVWDFIHGVAVDARVRDYLLDLSDTRNADLQRFLEKCMARIEKNPNQAFRMAFK